MTTKSRDVISRSCNVTITRWNRFADCISLHTNRDADYISAHTNTDRVYQRRKKKRQSDDKIAFGRNYQCAIERVCETYMSTVFYRCSCVTYERRASKRKRIWTMRQDPVFADSVCEEIQSRRVREMWVNRLICQFEFLQTIFRDLAKKWVLNFTPVTIYIWIPNNILIIRGNW